MERELFQWADAYSVGLQEVDEQHKVLVGLLNELHDMLVRQAGSEQLRQTLDRLADYTRIHFTVEESLMRLLDYPEFASHKDAHEELLKEIAGLQWQLDGDGDAVSYELLEFLRAWLTRHISESDRHFGVFAADAGLSTRWSPAIEQAMNRRKWRWKFG